MVSCALLSKIIFLENVQSKNLFMTMCALFQLKMAASVATPSSSPARGDLSSPAPTPPSPHSQVHPEQEFYLGLSRGNNTDSPPVAVGGGGGRPESETGRMDRVGSDEEEEEGETGPSSARTDTGRVATNATSVAKSGNFPSPRSRPRLVVRKLNCNKARCDPCISRKCVS